MKVIFGRDVPNEVLKLIDEAQSYVLLVSAYFDSWTHLDTAVRKARLARNVRVEVIVRGSATDTKQYDRAAAWKALGVEVHRVARLHAKCYASEKGAIITSLNLVQESAVGSWEAGVVLAGATEAPAMMELTIALRSLLDEAKQQLLVEQRAERSAPRVTGTTEPSRLATTRAARAKPASKRPASPPRRSATEGTCISCGESIKLKLDRPFCRECFSAWRDETDEDPNEEQSFCHTCGDEMASTFRKPRCKECWSLGAGE